MSDFIGRPYENEKNKAIKYVKQLLDKASVDNKQSDKEELAEILRLLDSKRYGLVWEQHAEKVEELMKTKIPVFEEIKERKIKNSTDPKYNFLLVGDNLHSLHILEKTDKGKVDVIYIDPPYNTGNKDFKYNDKFVSSNDEWFHSKWLSFMESRLRVGVKLLKHDGVMFISIGDNEYANLKLLMEDILPDGYVTTLHVEMSTVQGMKVKAAKEGGIVKNAEYILVYSKDGHKNIMKHQLYDPRPYDTHYSKYLDDNMNLIKLKDAFHAKYPKDKLEKLDKMFITNSNFQEFVKNNINRICADDKVTGFKKENYPVGKIIKVTKNGRKYFIYNNGRKMRQLLILSASWGKADDANNTVGFRKIRGDWWSGFYQDMGNINRSDKEGGVKFSNGKKPMRLITQLLKATTDKNSLVLDFFAGSGTTGQAVEELNKRDGGHRHFILATNNENNIADEITYQRMKNILDLYPNQINLKYFRTKFISKNEPHLEEKLLANVKTLVELQNLTDLEGSHIAIVITTKQVSELNLTGVSKVYMRSRVRRFMEPEEQERYDEAGVQIIDIPDKY